MSSLPDDPSLWLEDVAGEDALSWVRAHNEPTIAELCDEQFDAMRTSALEVLDTDARIPYVLRRGEFLYNFWRDAANPRGLWRRTTLEQYRRDEPDWDVLIDVDELARDDETNWVWAGAEVIEPHHTRALIKLSRGGSDAVEIREFDMHTRKFLPDGFVIPEAKTQISWETDDSVLIGTDFGPGSLTDSGYPMIVKRWQRGTPLSDAVTLFTGTPSDVIAAGAAHRTPGFERIFIQRALDFFNDETFELRGDQLIRLDAPTDAKVSVHREWVLIELRSDWTVAGATHLAGTLLAADYDQFLSGTADLVPIFVPDAHTALNQYSWTRDHLVIVTLRDVASQVHVVTPGAWTTAVLPGVPANTHAVLVATDDTGDEIFLDSSGFTTPSQLMYGTPTSELTSIKSAPAFFDAENISVAQYFATSDDGTQIPYFVVAPEREGPGPVLLGGYGGFELPRTPGYDGVLGRLWLAQGGTYVLANIRGGGEYGPTWHTQAMQQNRHKVHEDFASVASDLVTRGITTVAQLGAQGGSNGGLLMGVMLTRYPERFGALVCGVPLLDMKRYHLLLAGASWVAEYGDPDDPEQWQYIAEYSPYHNIDGDRDYPELLITTSTRDDRVHPAHARKMTAALEAAGQPVRYYENIEGGHAGAADNAQSAFKAALSYRFLWQTLGPA